MEICSLSKLTVEIPPARELVGDGQGEVCLSPTYLLQGRPVGPGERISFAHAGGFQCQGCGKTVKSLLRGFCYPCGTRKAAADLFDVVAKGIVKIEIGQTYALKDVGQAHIDLAARKTTGSTVLIP